MIGRRQIAFLLALTALLTTAADARAQGDTKGVLGVGLIIGEPVGVSAKLYLSDNTAIAAAVGGAILGGGIHVHSDFLWHPWVLEDRDNFVLPAYVGVGLRALDHRDGADDDFHLGVRGVVGMLFDFKQIPLDVFVEVAPILDMAFADNDEPHDGLGIAVNTGVGARYYF